MATLKRPLFYLSIVPLLSACAAAIPQPDLKLDIGTARFPGTVLLLSNLEDNNIFRAEESYPETKGSNTRGHTISTRYVFKKTSIDVGRSSHHIFLQGLTSLFDKVEDAPTKLSEHNFDYQLIPSLSYSALHTIPPDSYLTLLTRKNPMSKCEAKVRYGAQLRYRDGTSVEFDSEWGEGSHEPRYSVLHLLLLPFSLLVDLPRYYFGQDVHLTNCYSTAFARAEEQAFRVLAKKISGSLSVSSSAGSKDIVGETASQKWATDHAGARLKLAHLITDLMAKVPVNPPRRIIVAPIISTNEQLNEEFRAYVWHEILDRMAEILPHQIITQNTLRWTLNQRRMKPNDLHNIDLAREVASATGTDSILFGTFATEEPWIKAHVSLRDLLFDTEIAVGETKLYKDVTLRTLLGENR